MNHRSAPLRVVAAACALSLVASLPASLSACGSSDASGADDAGEPVDAGKLVPDASLASGSDAATSPPSDASAVSDADTGGGDAAITADSGADGGESSDGVPFSATGPWRYKLPASTPVASNSAAVVAAFQADITRYFGTWSINTDGFSSPYFVVPAGTPTQTWTWNNCGNQATIYPAFAASLANIPTASGFLVSMGTDEEISLYSPATDTYWDFWQAQVDAKGQWSACYGGKIDHASTDPGIFGQGLGATACGLPLGGWLMRIDELQAGVIEHALGFQMVSTQATNFSWPANRTDGKTDGADFPMEGQRFRLDPTFDVSTLGNPAERTIAKALQDYGMLLTDTSGAVILQAEDERPYAAAHGGVNPYPAIWNNVPVYSVLKDLPLSRLQALPKDYGMDFMK